MILSEFGPGSTLETIWSPWVASATFLLLMRGSRRGRLERESTPVFKTNSDDVEPAMSMGTNTWLYTA